MPQQTSSISSATKCLFFLGALYSSMSIALQAVAAHLSETFFPIPHGREMLHTAADIALWHGIAICALSLNQKHLHPTRSTYALSGMALGTLCFSVPVTLHGLGHTFLSHLAPIGGSLLILSWAVMGSCIFTHKTPH